MTQNIYDNPAFFAEYSRLRRSVEGLDGAPEWPALRTLVPDLTGRRVVDLGCGFGWFCRWARQAGAAEVLGLDVSENMLARARVTDPDAAVTYRRQDLERLELPPAAFDLAYSSLALHYIANLEGLLAQLHRALAPGGRLVASVEHPIYSAPSDPKWVRDAAGRDVWPVDRYLEEGPRVTDWLAKGVVKRHRTIGSYIGCCCAPASPCRISRNGARLRSRSPSIWNMRSSASDRRSSCSPPTAAEAWTS